MIKIADRTPGWVYELATIAGGFDSKLPEAVLEAKALAGHVVIVKPQFDDIYSNDQWLNPRFIKQIPKESYIVEIRYNDGEEHEFSYADRFQFYVQKVNNFDRYFIIFRAFDDSGELVWFVGKPLNVVMVK